ncbi:MAG: hypothetical protein ABIN80_28615 [Dyadobacter sp.]|uniref:hypothetical protein n=1 Tax=Dyadobacter sp. TaxID=1914288 RepID=UPI0032655763
MKAAINNYVSEMQKLIEQGAQLDGQSDAAKWLTGIGSVAMVIPTGYTQIAGVVLNVAGMIVGAAEKKKDSKALQQLSGQARQIQLDMGQIKTYLDNYEAELQKINLLPIVLFATAAYLIRNRI